MSKLLVFTDSSSSVSKMNHKEVSSSVILIFFCVQCLCSTFLLYHDDKTYVGSNCFLADGGGGTCVLRSNCTNSLKNHREEVICGFLKKEPIICCPNLVYTGPYPALAQVCHERMEWLEKLYRLQDSKQEADIVYENYTDTLDLLKKSYAENWTQKCRKEATLLHKDKTQQDKYEFKCNFAPFIEGLKPAPAIYASVQGDNTQMVALGWTNLDGTINWHCGGSLIHKSFVLTAAHCMTNLGKLPDIARVADVDLKDNSDDVHAINYDIEQVYLHENYTDLDSYNDIAILKVKKRPEFRFKVRPLPACIFLDDKLPVNQLLMMGYGSPEISVAYNERLYEGNLTILANSECEKFYEENDLLPNGLVDHQMCAYDPDGILDTCQGDSGGPLLFRTNDVYRTPYVAATISFGLVCNEKKPGVYTRLFPFLVWIEKTIRDNY